VGELVFPRPWSSKLTRDARSKSSLISLTTLYPRARLDDAGAISPQPTTPDGIDR
jgi:hypothetical protein